MPAPARGRTSAFERIRALPDQRVVDRLLRSRLCIWVIGGLLGGIVAMQVSLLRLNTGISRAVQTQTTLERQNAALESSIAALTSGDRVRAAAVKASLVDPEAGDTRYLRARPGVDADLALKRMKPPSSAARAVMANGGRVPGAPAAATAGTAAGTQTTPGVTRGVIPVPTAVPAAAPQG